MDDPFVKMAQEGVEGFSYSMIPGIYWVEFLPFLRHLPSWIPGTASRKLADLYLPYVIDTRDKPWAETKATVVSSTLRCTQFDELIKWGQRSHRSRQHYTKKSALSMAGHRKRLIGTKPLGT